MKRQQETESQAQAATFPDGTRFDLGANYDVPDLSVEDPDPNMHYYLAAKDAAGDRPDSVVRCKQMGYRESSKKCASPDCVLMEIPMNVYEARQRARHERDNRNVRDAMNAGKEFRRTREDGRHGTADSGE